jgi:hypothetical protein
MSGRRALRYGPMIWAEDRPRYPTDPGLFPKPRPLEAVPATLDSSFGRIFPGARVQRVRGISTRPFGHYIVLAPNATPWLYAKLLPTHAADRLKQADVLARACAEAGLVVPVLRQCHVLTDLPNSTLLVFDFLSGRAPEPALIDPERLGYDLAVLHAAMRPLGPALGLPSATAAWIGALEHRRRAVLAGQTVAPTPAWAAELLTRWTENAAAALDSPTACHGDLHAGNILISQSGRPMFLDFEDALHSFLWPGFDIAKLIERLFLVPSEGTSENDVTSRVSAMLQSYRKQARMHPLGRRGQMRRALEWHICVSVLVIVTAPNAKSSVWMLELDKMRRLAELHQRHRAWWEEAGESLTR